jgi:hypothetical protein
MSFILVCPVYRAILSMPEVIATVQKILLFVVPEREEKKKTYVSLSLNAVQLEPSVAKSVIC